MNTFQSALPANKVVFIIFFEKSMIKCDLLGIYLILVPLTRLCLIRDWMRNVSLYSSANPSLIEASITLWDARCRKKERNDDLIDSQIKLQITLQNNF